MPIPKPNKNENEKDFMNRCMGDAVMNKEFSDQKQRAGVCITAWREKQKEIKEMECNDNIDKMGMDIIDIDEEIEIFEAGKWNGNVYTEEDLQDIVDSFNEIGNQLKPYVKLGHAEDQKLLQHDGYPSAGWITGLRRDGKKLFAKIKNVPSKIAELIKSKAYGRISSEIFWNITMPNGKKYKKALRAIALLGGDTPEVTTLNDFISLYENMNYEKVEICNNHENITTSNNNNNIEEKSMQEFAEKLTALEAKVQQAEIENKKLKDENDSIRQKLEEHKKYSYMKEVKNFLDDKIKEKKLMPSQYEDCLALMSDDFDKKYVYKYSKEDGTEKEISGTKFELLSKIIDNNSIAFSGMQTKQTEINTELSENDKLHMKIEKYMKENKCDYSIAYDAMSKGV